MGHDAVPGCSSLTAIYARVLRAPDSLMLSDSLMTSAPVHLTVRVGVSAKIYVPPLCAGVDAALVPALIQVGGAS